MEKKEEDGERKKELEETEEMYFQLTDLSKLEADDNDDKINEEVAALTAQTMMNNEDDDFGRITCVCVS
jgi:hypothetical protein